jgi:hypothetical protein
MLNIATFRISSSWVDKDSSKYYTIITIIIWKNFALIIFLEIIIDHYFIPFHFLCCSLDLTTLIMKWHYLSIINYQAKFPMWEFRMGRAVRNVWLILYYVSSEFLLLTFKQKSVGMLSAWQQFSLAVQMYITVNRLFSRWLCESSIRKQHTNQKDALLEYDYYSIFSVA